MRDDRPMAKRQDTEGVGLAIEGDGIGIACHSIQSEGNGVFSASTETF